MTSTYNADRPFCVSAYDGKASHEVGGESRDSYFNTKDEARDAFERLVKGRNFYAVAYGYRGATGEFDDYDEWTADDPE